MSPAGSGCARQFGALPARFARLALACGLCVLVAFAAGRVTARADAIRGLPFTRSYPLDEIGNVPRGARLSFDLFGRLAVIHNGVYGVLNDTVWVDLADKTPLGGALIVNVVPGPEERLYFGARGAWGIAEIGPTGRLSPVSLVPPDAPQWTEMTSFVSVVATAEGVYFAGWDGVVFWDVKTRRNQFFAIPSVSALFAVGDRVFVSPHGRPLHEVDVARGELREVPGTGFGRSAVESATPLDAQRALLCVRDGRLMVFDGRSVSDWALQARHGLTGTITAVQQLSDGGTAVAITGRGLFLLAPSGELVSALTAPQYHRITSLAAREPGVLWVSAEDSIEKVLYGSPLTSFGQKLGLPVSWPLVMHWEGRTLVASRGLLYEAVPGRSGAPARFEAMAAQPAAGAWAAATSGPRLLVGNAAGVFAAGPDGSFTRVECIEDVLQLVAVGDELCFVIGRTEIAALRWDGARWVDCAPHIPAIGYPAVILHASRQAAWIELGANRVARLSLANGALKLRRFDGVLGPDVNWVNVGRVGDIIVLSGGTNQRVFFDERTEAFCAAPELARLLERSPHWVLRVVEDEHGVLWGAHEEGVVTFTPKDGDFEVDAFTFDLINDRHPVVRVLAGNDIWITAGRSLHHVDSGRAAEPRPPRRPVLVSVADGRTNVELLHQSPAQPSALLRLPFAQNSLSFRFFSGSYAWRRAPVYEFRLNPAQQWGTIGSGVPLNFPGLREGSYALEVKVSGRRQVGAAPTVFGFEILPPWHRTWPAFAGYALGIALAVFGLVRWSSHQTRRRNVALEQLVRERTEELEQTMAKLNEETRNSATLAERDRVAGEIHDSLQQGLSGLMLQLDATLRLPAVTGELRSRLHVARNMVSFTRQEVQHAIWDLESPLLDHAELGDALRKLAALINSSPAEIDISVSGAPAPLASTVKHHLMRIAQEALTNAVRHAAARRIELRLEYQPGALTLTVTDDGTGFQSDEVIARGLGHFGLRGLRGRAAKIGAELSIASRSGQGTQIRVVVPLPTAAPGSSSDAILQRA